MNVIEVEDLDATIERYKADGYRLDMIFPADDPRQARLSCGGDRVLLVRSPGFSRPNADRKPPEGGTPTEWIRGRAGMEYRDLIPDRVGGKAIASHIRLVEDGPVSAFKGLPERCRAEPSGYGTEAPAGVRMLPSE